MSADQNKKETWQILVVQTLLHVAMKQEILLSISLQNMPITHRVKIHSLCLKKKTAFSPVPVPFNQHLLQSYSYNFKDTTHMDKLCLCLNIHLTFMHIYINIMDNVKEVLVLHTFYLLPLEKQRILGRGQRVGEEGRRTTSEEAEEG